MSTSDGPATTAASTSADTLHTAADSDSAFSGCMNGYRIFLAAELKADHQEMATEIVKANGGTLSDSYDDEPQILVTNSWSGVRLCPERGTVLLARSIGHCLASCCYRVIFRPQGTSSFLEPIDARWIVDLGFLRRWQTTGVKPPRPFFWCCDSASPAKVLKGLPTSEEEYRRRIRDDEADNVEAIGSRGRGSASTEGPLSYRNVRQLTETTPAPDRSRPRPRRPSSKTPAPAAYGPDLALDGLQVRSKAPAIAGPSRKRVRESEAAGSSTQPDHTAVLPTSPSIGPSAASKSVPPTPKTPNRSLVRKAPAADERRQDLSPTPAARQATTEVLAKRKRSGEKPWSSYLALSWDGPRVDHLAPGSGELREILSMDAMGLRRFLEVMFLQLWLSPEVEGSVLDDLWELGIVPCHDYDRANIMIVDEDTATDFVRSVLAPLQAHVMNRITPAGKDGKIVSVRWLKACITHNRYLDHTPFEFH